MTQIVEDKGNRDPTEHSLHAGDMIRDLFDCCIHESIVINEENGVGPFPVRLPRVCDAAGIDDKDAILGLIALRDMDMAIDYNISELFPCGMEERGIVRTNTVAMPVRDENIPMPAVAADRQQLLGAISIAPITIASDTDNIVIAELWRENIVDIILDVSCMDQEIKRELLSDCAAQELVLTMGITNNNNSLHRNLL